MRPIFLFYLAGFLMTLNSCNKEKATNVTESKLELLTGRRWQLTNLFHQEPGDNTISDFTTIHYKSCEMDDNYNFTKDHEFFRRDSTVKCVNDPQFGLYGNATWQADTAFSTIVFTTLPYRYNMEIKTLTENTLELKHATIDYFNNKIFYTYRFKSVR
jgi:hypothetical protein